MTARDSNAARQLSQHTGNLDLAVRLRQKPAAFGQIRFPQIDLAGGCDDLDRGPATPHRPGELQTVHRARHLDIRENHIDVAASFQNVDGFIGTARLDHLESCGGNHIDRVHSQQKFVLDDQHHGAQPGRLLDQAQDGLEDLVLHIGPGRPFLATDAHTTAVHVHSLEDDGLGAFERGGAGPERRRHVQVALRNRAKKRHGRDRSGDEDQQLVARTQSGDAAAFDQLVVKYTPRLYGLVYNMTSNHEDTNDLLQDVFSKAYKAIRGFRGKSSFYTWIHSIAVNMTLNFIKKRGRRFQLSLDDVDASVQNDREFLEATATNSPVREADLSELQKRLNEAMMKLSDEHRAVVTMFHIQGMPHAEISKILRVSEGTVRSRLFYANRQLQNYLDEFRKNPVT